MRPDPGLAVETRRLGGLHPLFLALLLAGCASDGGSGAIPDASVDGALDTAADTVADTDAGTDSAPPECKIEPTIGSLEEKYFEVGCTFGSCHSVQEHKGDLVLTSGQAWDQLVNMPAMNPAAAGLGLVRVVPGDPDQSFLIQKVEGPAASHGDLMPPGAKKPIDPSCRIAMLRAWIASGAPTD